MTRNYALLRTIVLLLALFGTAVTGQSVKARDDSLKIGIIGTGKIGGTLGELWAKAGHRVFLSSRHPEQLRSLAQRIGPNA